MQRKASKRQFLQSARAWNERARLVESPLFQQSDFFDPRDKVQVKYEMLRAALVDGASVSEVSHQFGYSRETFYTSAELFGEQGVVGLADAKRGPKQPRKLTPEVQEFLVREMESNPGLSGRELAERVTDELAVQVHHRSVERFRSAHGKKNCRARRRRGACK
jgi:transposase